MPVEERYPWDLWFNGDEHRLMRGIHFNGKVTSFQKAIYAAAKRRHVSISVSIENEVEIIVRPPQLAVISPIEVLSPLENVSTNSSRRNNVGEIKLSEKMQSLINGETEYVEFEFPQDFQSTSRRAAATIAKLAKKAGFDITAWKFDYSNRDKLEIRTGKLAEDQREWEREQQTLMAKVSQDNLIPITRDKMTDFLADLEKDGYLQLKYGIDYSCASRKLAAMIMREATLRETEIKNMNFDSKSIVISAVKDEEFFERQKGINSKLEELKLLTQRRDKAIEEKKPTIVNLLEQEIHILEEEIHAERT